jgi:AbrB family looped-hinge helix DNA binding protein
MQHNLHDKKLYGTATVGTKGQIVIPSDAREELDIKPGDKLYIAGSVEKKVLFCLKEEQLRALVEHLTSNVEAVNKILNNKK